MIRVFDKGPGDQSSIPGRVIPKTQKTVLDVSLFNTQHKAQIKGKWIIQGKEYHPPLHLSVAAIENGAFGFPSTTVANYIYIYIYIYIYVP